MTVTLSPTTTPTPPISCMTTPLKSSRHRSTTIPSPSTTVHVHDEEKKLIREFYNWFCSLDKGKCI